MLETELLTQLRGYMERLVHPIRLAPNIDDSESARELMVLLTQLAQCSDKIQLLEPTRDAQLRAPSFGIARQDDAVSEAARVRFAGIPLGHEFTSLVLALLHVSGYAPKVEQALLDSARALDDELVFESYYSLSCQNCPDVVQALNMLAALNPKIRHTAIDGALFQAEVSQRQVMSVPSVFLDGKAFAQGRMELAELLAKLDQNAPARTAIAIREKAPFDVLVIGGGPAGAAAAIYAARKGIRTGLVAERFGGQLLDTMGIENFIATSHTEGPALVRQLAQHVRDYPVDVITGQRVQKLIPSETAGGLIELQLHSGASLHARTVILATGARWRTMNVPGEDAYRNRGVAFCPHCDGPLFKGKRVAVIGGGNSGVEAAIDLAGLASEVTLLEFDTQLRADDVLQKKLRSLANVVIHTNASTQYVEGDGEKVQALVYQERSSKVQHHLPLEGVFVQIGLLPNSEWLHGSVALSARGEILIDERGQTNVPGVFAAGDVTTVPYKQIVIAMGAGSTAALSAFDYLIRTPSAQAQAQAA